MSERRLLVLLVLLHWAVIAVAAALAGHNGWLYYAGGDETWYYTTAWIVGRGELPQTAIGYGLPYLYAPFTWIAGPNLLAALPWIIAFNGLLVAPIGLLSTYGIAKRLAGRSYAVAVAAAWALAPLAGLLFLVSRYREFWIDHLLAQTTGLTTTGDYVSMVAVLAAACLLLRAVAADDLAAAVFSGLAGGFALGVKPANAPFLVAALLTLLLFRRARIGATFAAAVVPAVVALAVWKARGLGVIPILAFDEYRVAFDVPFVPTAAEDRYLRLDRAWVGEAARDLREYTYSGTLLLLLPIAGAIAWFRRFPFGAVLLALWLTAFVAVKGGSGTVDDATFFRYLMPSVPAFFLLVAAGPLLLPPLRKARWLRPERCAPLRHRRSLAAAAFAVLGLGPLLLVAIAEPVTHPRAVKYFDENQLLAVDPEFKVRAGADDYAVRLTWDAPDTGATRASYRIFRSADLDAVMCTPVNGSVDCALSAELIAVTDNTTFRDHPPLGRWTYRIGMSANWNANPASAPVLLLSDDAFISVG